MTTLKGDYRPININKGNQKYCLINAVGNALSVKINREIVDSCIEEYTNSPRNKKNVIHGIRNIGCLSIDCLHFCLEEMHLGHKLVHYPKDFCAIHLIRYLRFIKPEVGIIYGWKSFPVSKSSDAPWKTLSHAIAVRNGHFINDYHYKTDLVLNVTSIDEVGVTSLLKHFDKSKPSYPYSFRFYYLQKLPRIMLGNDQLFLKKSEKIKRNLVLTRQNVYKLYRQN